MPSPPEYEAQLREQLDRIGASPRAELFHVLLLPDFECAAAIGDQGTYPKTRSLAELLIDAEEDRMVRAMLVCGTKTRRCRARLSRRSARP